MSVRFDPTWSPPGPVAGAFMASRARLQIINGPVGSGKTTAALMKAVKLAQRQAPSTKDSTTDGKGQRVPVRKFKLCVVRDTYRQLWKTTLPSWFKRVPRDVGQFSGADNAPASHIVKFVVGDGSIALLQADFIAIGENAVENVLRGYEPTAFYLNEMDLLSEEVLDYARTRLGRYPDQSEGGPSWTGIIGDCNAPEFHSYLYRRYFTKSPERLSEDGVALFRQPGGMDPGAENLANLPAGYYDNQVRDAPDWIVQRMVHNRPGYSRAGKPVYPEFSDALHVAARELPVVRGLPLAIGLDAGGNPAAVLAQKMPNGQWRILDELTAEPGTGPRRFARDLAALLHARYADVGEIRGYADPSAAYGADRADGEQDWIEIVAAVAGIRIVPGPTNSPVARWEAVRLPLTRLIDGAPGLLLSPRCERLRVGFANGYRYRKMNTSDERYDERAEKNDYSHPHDALQYLCSGGGEDLAIRERRTAMHGAQHARPGRNDWDPLAAPAAR